MLTKDELDEWEAETIAGVTRKALSVAASILVVWAVLTGGAVASAAVGPSLTITPVTWNVIGLDSNNVTAGPNIFPVGARVCNSGDVEATTVTATFDFDSVNPLIRLSGASTRTVDSLSPGACEDFYFDVMIERDPVAYDTTRSYYITVSADGVGAVSTPTPRELYVERLVSQFRNDVISVTGPSTVYVGQTYTYTVVAKTATNGYEQLENFLTFPNTIFQVEAVSTTYSAPAGATNDKFYADACGWDNDPGSPTYRECVGPANYTGGKAGGDITTTYTVRVVSAGSADLTSLVYDFSGSSYHYNSDFGQDVLAVSALDPTLPISADVSIGMTHSGEFVAGQNGTYTITVRNAGPSAAAGPITVTDSLPDGLSFVSGGGGGSGFTCSPLSQTVTCTRSTSLASGESASFELVVGVGAGAAPSVTNVATVTTATDDPTSSNNTATDETSVTAPAPANAAPEALADDATTAAGQPMSIGVAANDRDPDGNLDPATVTVTAGPSHGSVTCDPDGVCRYAPAEGFSGTDSFTYEICDTEGACDTAVVTVTVTADGGPRQDSPTPPDERPRRARRSKPPVVFGTTRRPTPDALVLGDSRSMLPATGADVRWATTTGLALLVAGIGLVTLARRRT